MILSCAVQRWQGLPSGLEKGGEIHVANIKEILIMKGMRGELWDFYSLTLVRLYLGHPLEQMWGREGESWPFKG